MAALVKTTRRMSSTIRCAGCASTTPNGKARFNDLVITLFAGPDAQAAEAACQ